MLRSLLFAALAAVIITAGTVGWFAYDFRTPGPLATDKTVIIPRGTSVRAIAKLLQEHGVIRSTTTFLAGSYAHRNYQQFKAGEYAFAPGISALQVTERLASGDVVIRKVTIPEGLTFKQIITIVNAAEGLEGNVPDDIKEGELLPDTYHYSLGDERAALVERMRVNMEKALSELWPRRADGLPLSTPQEALILASIVEKETGVPAERPRVAAAFINRLRQGIKLQSDPTVIYALTNGSGALNRRLLRKDWEFPSPINTYYADGLPPQPIANPGRASLEAVLRPSDSKEIFFVSDGKGGHLFAATLAEHNRNVAALQKIRAENRKLAAEAR